MSKLVFCLMGPTASGKTGLAIDLVQEFPLEIISVDSAMIYRGMDIGTAKPSQEELQLAPHHLIDIIDPVDAYSAAQFCTDAINLCGQITKQGKIPLLVGGTMMYFNALQQGLSVLPEANEDIRLRLEQEAADKGWGALHQQLQQIDPVTAARIHANDTQRIQRALEVYLITGTSLSDLLASQKQGPDLRFINIALFPQDRKWLHDRIALRFQQMLAQGFVAEVRTLQRQWQLQTSLPAMRCVGYRQALEHVQGDYDYTTMVDKGIAATRQLAKRQLTWLRGWDDILYYDPQNPTFDREIMAKTQEILDNEFS